MKSVDDGCQTMIAKHKNKDNLCQGFQRPGCCRWRFLSAGFQNAWHLWGSWWSFFFGGEGLPPWFFIDTPCPTIWGPPGLKLLQRRSLETTGFAPKLELVEEKYFESIVSIALAIFEKAKLEKESCLLHLWGGYPVVCLCSLFSSDFWSYWPQSFTVVICSWPIPLAAL